MLRSSHNQRSSTRARRRSTTSPAPVSAPVSPVSLLRAGEVGPRAGMANNNKVDPDRDKWEEETERERALRRAKNQALLGLEAEKKNIYDQEVLLVLPLAGQEDAILHIKSKAKAAGEEGIKDEKALENLRVAREAMAYRLKLLRLANGHGWELVSAYEENNKEGEDKEILSAYETLRRKKKERTADKNAAAKSRGGRRDRFYSRGRDGRDDDRRSSSGRRSPFRYRSPQRYDDRDGRGEGRDGGSRYGGGGGSFRGGGGERSSSSSFQRGRSPSRAGVCFTCNKPGHYSRNCAARKM